MRTVRYCLAELTVPCVFSFRTRPLQRTESTWWPKGRPEAALRRRLAAAGSLGHSGRFRTELVVVVVCDYEEPWEKRGGQGRLAAD